MNRVILTGNLTKNPDLITTGSGIAVCRFTLAVQRKLANEDGEREADFINIVAWRGLAENCNKYLSKGKKAGVVGSIVTRTYDAIDGTKRYVTEVIADEVEFLSSAEKVQNAVEEPEIQNEKQKFEAISDDKLPF